MAVPGRGRQAQAAAIWPGFLDLMTALVMVLMFVITVFMIVQFALRETINSQDDQLDDLTSQLSGLADSLGMERARSADLESQLGGLTATLAGVRGELAASEADLAGAQAELAGARDELAGTQAELAATEGALMTAQSALAAAEAERARLSGQVETAEGRIAALTLSLEAQRARAEETLTLLAAAEAARKRLDADLAARLSDADRQKGLLAAAEAALAGEKEVSAEGARKLTLLNEQVAALRSQLASLQDLLDASAAEDRAAQVQIEALGSQLNSALARVAAEEKKRAALEAAEAERLAAEAAAAKDEAAAARDEAKELARYRSEFFGRLSELLAGREGVRVVGDRFVFSSEVLFEPASADLADEGRAQIAGVVATLQEVSAAIPPEIDWIIRVDGHTDATPLSGSGAFADNWELSQARALSVVRYMQNDLGFPPERMAATGFGEFRPVATGDSPEALAANRRIELKLTER
jgi:chemotaxis protein MotB